MSPESPASLQMFPGMQREATMRGKTALPTQNPQGSPSFQTSLPMDHQAGWLRECFFQISHFVGLARIQVVCIFNKVSGDSDSY